MKTIYLDNNATTPCDPEVVAAMLPFLAEYYGNAGSPHVLGRKAASAVARAREQVGALAGCDASNILFTSGATESNNLVILGIFDRKQRGWGGIVTSVVEHKAVLEPCQYLAEGGVPVSFVPALVNGSVNLELIRETFWDSVRLVSVQAANNETGVIQPVAEVSRCARDKGAMMHCDAAQALGKIPFSVFELGLDFASFSSHKIYGPKGVGALFVRNHAVANRLAPRAFGGGQEGGLRPGTLNVAGTVGFGEACHIAREQLQTEMKLMGVLRDRLELDLSSTLPDASVNSADVDRLPGTTSVTIPGVPADVLVSNVPAVCFSNGSACTSGTVEPSHVLLAMGLSREAANCTIRLSVGRYTTAEEIPVAVRQIAAAVSRLKAGRS